MKADDGDAPQDTSICYNFMCVRVFVLTFPSIISLRKKTHCRRKKTTHFIQIVMYTERPNSKILPKKKPHSRKTFENCVQIRVIFAFVFLLQIFK